jgi:hypothetical protein
LYRVDKGSGNVVSAPQLALPLDVEDTGEVRLYRFTLPFLPPSKNVMDAWPQQWKSSAKKKWANHIRDLCDSHMVPKGQPRVGLAATLVFASKARRDPQNYAQALWHWVPDALVKAGVVVDDDAGRILIGPNWGLEFAVDPRSGVPKVKRQRTILALTMKVGG